MVSQLQYNTVYKRPINEIFNTNLWEKLFYSELITLSSAAWHWIREKDWEWAEQRILYSKTTLTGNQQPTQQKKPHTTEATHTDHPPENALKVTDFPMRNTQIKWAKIYVLSSLKKATFQYTEVGNNHMQLRVEWSLKELKWHWADVLRQCRDLVMHGVPVTTNKCLGTEKQNLKINC